jgi:DNA helicase-2/ATP-dependent DNA helicase PcrA
MEEERRLFYVGMTRAKESLLISRAIYRRTYGEERLRASTPSRFLAEIPADLIEAASGSLAEPGQTRRYESDPDFSDSRPYRAARTPYRKASAGRTSSRGSGRQTNNDPLIGARVRHSKYGLGTIIEIEGEGEERKLTVSFQDYGPKKLIERYANLQLA